MARAIVERLLLEGELVLTAPLSLGGGEENWVSDIPVARNGAGKIAIPGTSIAGALRSWFEYDGEKTNPDWRAIWGFIDQDTSGSASCLTFHDAVMEKGKLQLRDHVGIDRVEGRAADTIKFDRQSVCSGACFSFRLSAEIPDGTIGEAVRNAVLNIRDVLASGAVQLGGATTRGYGGCKLGKAELSRIPLNQKAGFLDALSGTITKVDKAAPTATLKCPPRLAIRIGWKPLGPVMVKASEEGLAVKVVPLTTEIDGEKVPIIPGSSIKGVMRTMAERIMATVCNIGLPKSAGGTRFRAMIGESEEHSDRLVTALFGTASETGKQRRGRAALGFSDTQATVTFSQADWRRALDQAEGSSGLTDKGKGKGRREMQVAIDRFTAAPADGKLFSSLSLVGVCFTPIEIVLSIERLSVLTEAEQPAALGLLLLVLREMFEGQVPLGSGTTRGKGAMTIDSVSFSTEGNVPANSGLAELVGFTQQHFRDFVDGKDVSTQIRAIVEGWKAYVKQAKGAACRTKA